MIGDLFVRSWIDTLVVSAVILVVVGLSRLWSALVELGRKRVRKVAPLRARITLRLDASAATSSLEEIGRRLAELPRVVNESAATASPSGALSDPKVLGRYGRRAEAEPTAAGRSGAEGEAIS